MFTKAEKMPPTLPSVTFFFGRFLLSTASTFSSSRVFSNNSGMSKILLGPTTISIWIRFTTSHPKDAGQRLFRAIRDLDKVCEHLHLPLQSGSDKILDLMNRKYEYVEYKDRIDELRSLVPGVGFSTDIIVGFPSEKDCDYRSTYKAMEEIGYNSAFIFKYSPRPPAVSSCLIDDVSETEKKKRNNELLALQKKIAHQKNKELIGTDQEILVEGKSRMSDKELIGRTRNNTPCVFAGGEDLVGQLVKVKVKGTTPNTLKAEIIPDENQ